MVKFINKVTGSTMYVHETRIDEYIAAGHKMAPPPPLPEKPETPVKQEKPKRKK